MSTSLEGLGATLPPPMTNIRPLKLSALVSPVALGIAAIVPVVLVPGLKLNELAASISRPPWKSDAPPTQMMPPMAAVGAYMTPSGVLTTCVHFEPTAAAGAHSQICLEEATLMVK